MKFSEKENKLLFLALLNATDCVFFSHYADPSPRIVQANMEALYKILGCSELVLAELRSVPKYVISANNNNLSNIHRWIDTWNEVKNAYKAISFTLPVREKLRQRELILNKFLYSDMETTEYAGKLASWAMDAANVPGNLREYWIELFKLKGEEIFKVKIVDLQELVEHMETKLYTVIKNRSGYLPYASKVLEHVRNILKIAEAGRIGQLGGSLFEIIDDDDLTNIELPNFVGYKRPENISYNNAKIAANSAPEKEPKIGDYKGNISAYAKAKAAWRLSESIKEAVGKRETERVSRVGNDLEDYYWLTLEEFNSRLQQHKTFEYIDQFVFGTYYFEVVYLFSTGEFLSDLEEKEEGLPEEKKSKVCFCLRIDVTKRKYYCLVRLTEDSYIMNNPLYVKFTGKSVEEGKKGSGVTRDIELNEKQALFLETVLTGKDVVLIGAAGSGKTTCTGKAIRTILADNNIPCIGADTKWLSATAPGIIVTSYTRKAVNNIRRAVPEELKKNTHTLHKFLEFAPEFFEIEDSNTGMIRKTVKFIPKRNRQNPLPPGIKLAFFEESSMIGTDLYNLWKEATPHLPQEVFIGDIQQLPPIFGPAILGFKMALLPVIELTEIYRQALKSPIIRLAHAILSGDPTKFAKQIKLREEKHPYLGHVQMRRYCPSLETFNESGEDGTVKFQIWQKNWSAEKSCYAVVQQFILWIPEGYYNPMDDIILCPFNKSFGTTAINKGIMQHLSRQRGAEVHEIIAGFNSHYFAVGDRVLYDKEDAVVTDIRRNTNYWGKPTKASSMFLDRDGNMQEELTQEELDKAQREETEFSLAEVEDMLLDYDTSGDEDDEKRTQAASHCITIKFSFSDEEIELRTAAEVNNLLGGHAITVHKFQGSENKKVFIVLHKSHAVMVQRELLYTAVTRAREFLHIICENDTFFNGVRSQKVKGTTLAEKIETFKGKGKFLEMQEEMRMLEIMQNVKEKRLKKFHADREIADKLTEKLDDHASH
ncbi:unnamed protein product [Sphagnum jensenii]